MALLQVATDLIRLYPNDNNLHVIARDLTDKLSELQVKIMQLQKEKFDESTKCNAQILKLQQEIKHLKK
ncbi:MAG: hypothetical protein DKM50_08300 [Candidatus Margulisiibacteriota bacterium]|nr:MAG: hypothetical protein A2X43_03080 [Candidatus Margulisbacteria bacterium GWD2_39_127]OGI04996.1 MAG: hypothetical protein A2X42_05345 [Candidatus Margulisbacteria bacterium GWF2_38_17]OGI08992.1 MAG: hypothetical protein A2X41_01540 [Candidatus Margulisbacteria bacterium GWE2_39_32]PZM79596.1 MAG: hypothetical protein DKM50_08300 [Candidatus Margulisiibacteriota bacterium]HAR63222.1 hypothetical protein [Candidatus Margulisiibacteriota bacterium]